ncbi:TIGR04086 family membrane protein [Kineothrix sp. MB12-C1]|uniref:TIGR04086 family membrane protein n=1 Tax=Kineothrix sp. MB12-C1 TaxID=3070215 RepID=UPI0027D2007B|nr:TIGR04086 family membrane protein [Kineothrix sp. MB12-C1]WMC92206.1 TIGR04086 family membrane protein [Kineothrix sp. MB12-C1]
MHKLLLGSRRLNSNESGEGDCMKNLGLRNGKSTYDNIFLLKCLLFSYVLTAGLLLLLAFMLYRFSLQEKVVNICIILIYIAVTFLAGFIAGKRMGSRKFLWGLLIGVLYFVVLALVSLIVNRSLQDVGANAVTVLLLCAGGGMLGGMVS